MTRAALFDLDGVLLESGPALQAAPAGVITCATGRRIHPDELPPDALRRSRTDLLASLGAPDPETACNWWWDAALATAAAPGIYPEVLPGLRALRTDGTLLGVVTAQERHRLPWLLPPPLAELLEIVVTRQDATPKPAPDGLHAALDHLGVPPEDAVFVGDSPAT